MEFFKKSSVSSTSTMQNPLTLKNPETITGISSRFDSLQRKNEQDLMEKRQYFDSMRGNFSKKQGTNHGQTHQMQVNNGDQPYIIPSSEEERFSSSHRANHPKQQGRDKNRGKYVNPAFLKYPQG